MPNVLHDTLYGPNCTSHYTEKYVKLLNQHYELYAIVSLLIDQLVKLVYGRYLIASHTTDYRNPNLFLNTIAVCWLVIAKFPNMHRVRIFGINSDYDT